MTETTSNRPETGIKNPPIEKRANHIKVADGRFVLVQRIGSGAFGELFQGVDTKTNTPVAIKFEKRKTTNCPQLAYESKVYRVLHHGSSDIVGIPRIYYYGVEGDYGVLVMDLCGPSLEDLFNYCGRRFSVKTVCMLADQMLERIQFLHEKCFVHRDVKPENFVFGIGKRGHVLYLIDFGLSKLYWNKRKQIHVPFCEGKPLTGTARYCSTWTHRGYEQSRRDDLEAMGFIFVYFLVGSLPWQGMVMRNTHLKTVRIGEKKMSVPLDELCKGLPPELLQYCTYCREMRFTDTPNYAHLRDLFMGLARRQCVAKLRPSPAPEGVWWENVAPVAETQQWQYDWMFDWFLKRGAEVAQWRKRRGIGDKSMATTRSTATRKDINSITSETGARVMFC